MEAPIIPICKRLFLASVLSIAVAAPAQADAARRADPVADYMQARVADADGQRFWIFREGLYGLTPAPRWFMHGVFA